MKMFFVALLLLFGLMTSSVQASESNFYTTFSTGLATSQQKSVKDGFAAHSGFGWRWLDIIRTEFSVEYTSLKLRNSSSNIKADLPSWAGMATGYVDLFCVKNVTPYIGAGLGVSKNTPKDVELNGVRVQGDRNYRFAWKAVGGIGIALPQNLVLDLSYSYTDLGRYTTEDTTAGVFEHDLKVRQILVGLRYNF